MRGATRIIRDIFLPFLTYLLNDARTGPDQTEPRAAHDQKRASKKSGVLFLFAENMRKKSFELWKKIMKSKKNKRLTYLCNIISAWLWYRSPGDYRFLQVDLLILFCSGRAGCSFVCAEASAQVVLSGVEETALIKSLNWKINVSIDQMWRLRYWVYHGFGQSLLCMVVWFKVKTNRQFKALKTKWQLFLTFWLVIDRNLNLTETETNLNRN